MAIINVPPCPSSTTARTSLPCSPAWRSFKMFNGLHGVTASNSNSIQLDGTKPYFRVKDVGKTRAAIVSNEGDLLSYSNGNGPAPNNTIIPDAMAFGTLAADTAPIPNSFPIDDDEFDLDSPTEGFSSIPEAIEDIRQGKMVVVVDDEDRENEGDLIMAAELATPEALAFIVKHCTGIVCVSMDREYLDRLQLPLMVTQNANDEKLRTAFTVTVDAKHGTTTGVSAHDRATTVRALASRDSRPEDFNRPGHIFPLRYREGGVLKRAGHTEAAVDLSVLAGSQPVGVYVRLWMMMAPWLDCQTFVNLHNRRI